MPATNSTSKSKKVTGSSAKKGHDNKQVILSGIGKHFSVLSQDGVMARHEVNLTAPAIIPNTELYLPSSLQRHNDGHGIAYSGAGNVVGSGMVGRFEDDPDLAAALAASIREPGIALCH